MAIMTSILAVSLMQSAVAPPPPPGPQGGYIPNSQLLSWCKSKDPAEYATCFGYVMGASESASDPATPWPRGNLLIPMGTPPNVLLTTVVTFLETLPREQLSSPASASVYAALLADYPAPPRRQP